jgi:acyl-CoA thioester hydrolase
MHFFPIRVYYEDTDFSGFVYHANYLKFCERARSDMIRSFGFDQNAMAAEKTYFVVRKMDCDFLRPARFDDMLSVETTLTGFSGARFVLKQVVKRGDELLFEAAFTGALIDGRGRPKRFQGAMAEKLQLALK